MADSLGPPDPTDDLQFDIAEPAAPPNAARSDDALLDVAPLEAVPLPPAPSVRSHNCVSCKSPITDTYFAVRDKVICPACRDKFQAPTTGKFGRFLKATALGLGAGLVGAVIWFAIRRFLHMEIGLVAIVVGFMVGKAVRRGSGGRGGRGYQVLAVLLTYSCISANYIPDVLEALVNDLHNHPDIAANTAAATTQPADRQSQQADGPTTAPATAKHPPHGLLIKIGALVLVAALLFAFALATPVIAGFQSPIGLLIVCFALWEAWKFNRPLNLTITGPFQFGPGVKTPAPSLWIKP